jgi:hypothetical protein
MAQAERTALAVAASREAMAAKARAGLLRKPPSRPVVLAAVPSVPAMSSDAYEAAGGRVERLPAHWDTTPRPGRCGFLAREGSPKGRWV